MRNKFVIYQNIFSCILETVFEIFRKACKIKFADLRRTEILLFSSICSRYFSEEGAQEFNGVRPHPSEYNKSLSSLLFLSFGIFLLNSVNDIMRRNNIPDGARSLLGGGSEAVLGSDLEARALKSLMDGGEGNLLGKIGMEEEEKREKEDGEVRTLRIFFVATTVVVVVAAVTLAAVIVVAVAVDVTVVAVAVATAAAVAAAPFISSMEKAIHLFPISEPHPYPRHLPRPCP